MGFFHKALRIFTWWEGQTLNTQLWTWRKGREVGRDAQGNRFYQTRDGSRRWVIYKGEVEASQIGSDWHGWLHHTWDAPPTEVPMQHRPWEKPHVPNMTGTDQAYVPPGSIRRTDPVMRRDYEAWAPE